MGGSAAVQQARTSTRHLELRGGGPKRCPSVKQAQHCCGPHTKFVWRSFPSSITGRQDVASDCPASARAAQTRHRRPQLLQPPPACVRAAAPATPTLPLCGSSSGRAPPSAPPRTGPAASRGVRPPVHKRSFAPAPPLLSTPASRARRPERDAGARRPAWCVGLPPPPPGRLPHSRCQLRGGGGELGVI